MRIHGISKRKLGTDGQGVTDLISMASCPLSCKYCLNKNVLNNYKVYNNTPEEVLTSVMEEACYFIATGGGVTFGGGEPLMQWEAILEFAKIKPDWVKLNIETSLQASEEAVKALVPFVDFWMVDVKTLDSSLYKQYSGGNLSVVLNNLQILKPVANKVRIRVPIIPNYKNEEIADCESEILRDMGFEDIDVFSYIIR